MPTETADPTLKPVNARVSLPPMGGPPGGDGGEGSPSEPSPSPVGLAVSNARLGMVVFLGAEAMFFAGLIGAFLVFRLGSVLWPPLGQPRLPLAVTGMNTVVLLMSGVTMHSGLKALREKNHRGLTGDLSLTVLLGALFLGVQGYEWVRLVAFGLTLSSGIYGATFYTLIGCHALHVFGALVWVVSVLLRVHGRSLTPRTATGVELCGMYWYFVVALWPLLFALVYLN